MSQYIYDNIELVDNEIIIPTSILNAYDESLIEFVIYEKYCIDITDTFEYKIKEKLTTQSEFKKYLIERDKHCIITKSDINICDICHIIPHCDCHGNIKYDINNGIILESGLHKLFDKYLWSINPQTKLIEIKPHILNDTSYELLNKHHNKYIDFDNSITTTLQHHYNMFKST